MSIASAPVTPGRATARNNVTLHGSPDGPVLLLVHGFGSGQEMWQRVLPALTAEHRVVLFDQVGAGHSDPTAYDREKYSTLDGYAADLVEICGELDLHDVVLLAHSVGSMVAAHAAVLDPERFRQIIMLAPSSCYVDDPASGYIGGYSREDVEELLDSLDHNYLAWTAAIAPMVMGNPDRPELGAELTGAFQQTNPETARDFARVTFLSDSRELLTRVQVPAVVVQAQDDALAPDSAVREVAARLPHGVLVPVQASGHCPHVSGPTETAAVVLANLLPRL